MRKTLDAKSKDFKFFQDFWRFYQEFYVPEDSDEYWQLVVDAQTMITEKYERDPFVCEVMMATVRELERKYKSNDRG